MATSCTRRLCHTTFRSMRCSIASSPGQRKKKMMQDIKLPCTGWAGQIALTVSSKLYEGEATAIRSAPEWTRRQTRRGVVALEPVATACYRKRRRGRPVARPQGRSSREVDNHDELHRCLLARSSRIWPPERVRHHRTQDCGSPGSSGTRASSGSTPPPPGRLRQPQQ